MPILFYKKRFETPLDALNRLRLEKPELKDETLSYAGRLDPMAEGVLLVLVGEEENRDREKYLGLDKSYEVEVLLGISTDTGDVLGLVQNTEKEGKKVLNEEIEKVVKNLEGENNFPYPVFSSRTVDGKPLHEWAREGRLDEIEIPTKASTIYSAKLIDTKIISATDILQSVLNDIDQIQGNFRQEEIKKSWNESLQNLNQEFQIATISIDCSSGAYMRTIAEELGKKLGTVALAYRIKRTKIDL